MVKITLLIIQTNLIERRTNKMKKNYILINTKKLLIPTWLKLVIFYAVNSLFTALLAFIDSSSARIFNVSSSKIVAVTMFINIFVTLALMYDLIPKFKKIIAILYSIFYLFMYVRIDEDAHDYLYIGLMLLIFFMIFLNIVFSKRVKNRSIIENKINEELI